MLSLLTRWHYNARYFNRIALQVALEANGMPCVFRKVRKVLVLDVVDLTLIDEHELTTVLYASQRAIAIRYRRRAVLGSLFVVGATGAVADLAAPGVLRRDGSHNTKRQHKQAEKHRSE